MSTIYDEEIVKHTSSHRSSDYSKPVHTIWTDPDVSWNDKSFESTSNKVNMRIDTCYELIRICLYRSCCFRFWLINLSRTTKSTIYMTVGDLNGMVTITILRIRAANMVMIVPRTYRVVTILIMIRTFKFDGNKNCNFFYRYRFYLIYSASQVSNYEKDPKIHTHTHNSFNNVHTAVS